MADKTLNNKDAKDLFQAFCMIDNEKACRDFLRDLCTLSELQSMIERFQIAKRIENNETYREISKSTGASTTTITRVGHWLHHGTGGYRTALKHLRK